MKRFVYAPQVNAYVMTEEFGLVNLSPDIISGSVTRRLDAVSSATLTLQNKPVRKGGKFEGKYIRTIKPMDRIAIWLTRIHKPTLVFTGYIDDAPFDQLYPGPVTLTASCTLKRLLYTYFDPGLPYMQRYLAQFDWVYDFVNGTLTSSDQLSLANFDAKGGVGEILRATMHDIGGWDYDKVHVYKLPKAFITKAAKTFDKEVEETEQRREEIETFLKKLMTYEGSFSEPSQQQLNDYSFSSEYADNNPLPRRMAGEYRALIYGPPYSLAGLAGELVKEAAKEGITISPKEAQNAQEIFTQVRGNAFGYGNWTTKAACGFIGSAYAESGLDNTAVNPSSGATGLFQLLSGGFYGADGYIADVMKDLGIANPGSPQLRGAEAKNATYNTLAFLRDSIGQDRRSTIQNSQYPSWEIQRYFERPEASVLAFNHPYVQKGIKMTRAAQRAVAVAASRQAQPEVPAQKGEVGDVKVAPSFFPDVDIRDRPDQHYTCRIRGNPYGNDKMIFRIAASDSSLKPGEISIYVPGAVDDSTPQAANWQNRNVVIETSLGKASRFTDDKIGQTTTDSSRNTARFVYPIPAPHASNFTDDFNGGRGNTGNSLHNAIDIFAARGTPVVACVDGTITTLGFAGAGGNRLWINNQYYYAHFDRYASGLKQGDPVKRGQVVGYVGTTGSAQGTPPHLHFAYHPNGWNSNVARDGAVNPFSMLTAAKNSTDGIVRTDITTGTTPTSPNTVYGGTGVQWDQTDIAQIAFGVLMGTELTFPTTGIEAAFLQGDRALANDVPLMQWVEFMATASGRRFQSMPRGDFMAFYPDYFRWANEAPYWRISDIETIDLNISLSDQEIATHVFTVGDTMFTDSIDLWDRMASTVAGIESMGSFSDFVNIGGDQQVFAREFLERYGARPLSVERTDIKHSMLQYMYGWMKFLEQWSKQYVCGAQFTFMPELYPGGLVEFAAKDLVMFVEEVTHSFDLTGGFTTSASLTAPSTLTRGNYNHGMVLTQGGLNINNPKAPNKPRTTETTGGGD